MKPWPQIKSAKEQKVGWRWLTTKWFCDPDGKTQEYVTVGRTTSGAAATIAITTDNKIVVAEQFRPGPEAVMQEIPGGIVDEGETPEEAARRELLEETGYTSQEFYHLGTTWASGYNNQTQDYFIAYNCIQSADVSLDEGEYVDVQLITIEDLLSNGRNGRMTDVGALFLAYDRLQKLQKEEMK